MAELKHFTTKLNLVFSLKDLGNLHYFLGFEIRRDETGLFMSQKIYIQDLLQKFNFSNASSSSTPMTAGKQFSVEQGELMQNPTNRQLLGALQYVTNTRPDVIFVVNSLSRIMHKPTVVHWQAAKKIL